MVALHLVPTEGEDTPSKQAGPCEGASSSTSVGGASTGSGSAGTSDQAAEAKPEEEEESDLQLSWEILELARLICQRSEV